MGAATKLDVKAADLTMTFDPAALWPDPEDCPDWPLARDALNRAMNAPRSAEEARAKLRGLGYALNGEASARAPTGAECAAARERFFAEGSEVNWRWPLLGFGHLRPATPSVRDASNLIVEAAHIRGYLRKLETRAANAAQAKADAEQARLRALVDGFPNTLAGLERQLEKASEGEARHLQRVADEADARRAHDLRHQITATRQEAERAAARLGVTLARSEVA